MVEKLVSGGDGLVRTSEGVVLIPGVLPQETIRYTLEPKNRGVLRGQLASIETRSASRTPPLCQYYGNCGGCDLMHADYESQKTFKMAIVQESFQRLAHFDPGVPKMMAGSPWAYRTRIQLHKDENHRVGFKARGSDRLVKISGCPVAHKDLQVLFDPDPGSEAAAALESLGPGRWNAVAVDSSWRLEGRDTVATVHIRNKRLIMALSGFFQSNLTVLEALLDYVLDSFPQGGTEVWDLFCGAGLFGSFLADKFERVVGVEENTHALALAKKNVPGPLNEFYASSLEEWLNRGQRNSPQAVVVDPPRSGLTKIVKDFLAQHPPKTLVYVSCNPDTLARDAAFFKERGFIAHDLTLFDFYPQTSHIEAGMRFSYAR